MLWSSPFDELETNTDRYIKSQKYTYDYYPTNQKHRINFIHLLIN